MIQAKMYEKQALSLTRMRCQYICKSAVAGYISAISVFPLGVSTQPSPLPLPLTLSVVALLLDYFV
jgi:hypothetical protein